MTGPLSRRDWMKLVGAAGAGSLLSPGSSLGPPDAPPGRVAVQTAILPLTSTSEVFVPPRGRAFQKFSFGFPEPSVAFAGLRFGFLVFTRENAYGLDASTITVSGADNALTLDCSGLVWAGGQERAAGQLTARLRKDGDAIVWDVTAELDRPIKAVTTVLRGVPRGTISSGGGEPFDPHDNEILFGYPFGAGDLFGGNTAGGMGTPLAIVRHGDGAYFALSSLDDRVRAKRFYFQPGEQAYRVELVHEVEGWLDQRRVQVPAWRAGPAPSLEAAAAAHYAHLERAYHLPRWETRADVPDWLRRTALVMALHGMHYTGYVFNDFARMLEILRWTARRIPGERVLVFLPAWDGRYYWNYPTYRPAERLGGAAGFRRLIGEARQLGFKLMPMFGANAANRHQPGYQEIAAAATSRIDGDPFDLNWVDWDNDRHQEGWLAYMNLGVDSWRAWLEGRIAETIDRYGVDGYFLDIVAGWMNNPQADMHEGTRKLVANLRQRYPHVLCCGEFLYDALLEFIPLYQVYVPHAVPYARFFSHLSHPAPGRGSSGVHESGFGRWDAHTLGLARRDGLIPTLTVVDDTFRAHQDAMAAVIRTAKEWAGIG